MQKTQYINLNGALFEATSPVLYKDNRAFNYGDALFETLYAQGTHVHFLKDHLQRLRNGMHVLKMDITPAFDDGQMEREISRILNKNRLYKGVRVKIVVFRDTEGLYSPKTNKASYLIQATPVPHESYVLNEKGLVIDVFTELQQPINKLSNLKTTNRLINIMAGLYKTSHPHLDDCIIMNEKGTIAEAISSNLFITKGDHIYTPPLKDGCIAGVTRKKIIEISSMLSFGFKEHSLKTGDLLLADEIFLTNAIGGIMWVVAFKQKRYYNKTAKLMIKQLNKISLQKD